MASSSAQPPPPLNPPHPSPPSATSTISPPASTTASTVTTSHQPSTVSPPAVPSTSGSSVSSPQFPPPGTGPGPHHLPHHVPPHTAPSATVPLSTTLPPSTSPSSQRQISEARSAVLASIGNMLDAGLRDRASVLHSNAAAIARQERDVARATEGLRRENDRLARVAADAARKVKELGNVQNWAEVLESDFLALEETVRLVREGSVGSEGSWSGSEGSWSGSGSESGRDGDGDGDGDVRMDDVDVEGGEERRAAGADKGKGREVDTRSDDCMDVDGAEQSARRTGKSATAETVPDMPGLHAPAVQNVEREAPSIKVPGMEPSQTSTVSLEDELRSAMDQGIGDPA